ncbi:MAG: PD-(D/E)XK nuclease family protein [Candidatus Alkanophagales archaeon]
MEKCLCLAAELSEEEKESPDEPYEHHVLQAQLYSFITGSPHLVYIGSEFKIREFEVPPPDPQEIESAVAHAAVLRTPDPPEGRESWLCKYCPYPCKLRGGEG